MESTKGSQKREKKELTPKQKRVMNVLNWVATACCIVLVVFALVVAIFTIASTGDEEFRLPTFGDTVYMVVASDSMSPTFDKDDMIVGKTYDYTTDGELEIGQVVTFRVRTGVLNTHRIVAKKYDANGKVVAYVTRGDNQDYTWQEAAAELAKDESERNSSIIGNVESNTYASNIKATWGESDGTSAKDGSVLKGVGAFTNWIQDAEQGRTRFFCVVVLPLILLFVIYAFVLVRTLVIAKLENERKVQSEHVVTVDTLSDEEKRRLAQEYLASLAQNSSSENAATEEHVEGDIQDVDDDALINDSDTQ